ncbi:sugar phosphate nucleotidyltransferase [Permianibacter aggregans]|uniref:sugar phosphate nucleotidyltransferase n=1 Tax=Permianibacter aggregans TaxID=1510150 RepID=UPI0012FBCD31|nr:sugar phosphate nucleotidyltransferase [Permianibacter aggregans]
MKSLIILAGGLGTRLRSAVADKPKPLAPVAGKPFIDYLIERWAKLGFSSITLSVGYLGDMIEQYAQCSPHSSILRIVHEATPLGTGGAIRHTLVELSDDEEWVLVANGDTWFPCEPDKLASVSNRHGYPIVVAATTVTTNDRYGSIRVGENQSISRFSEPTNGDDIINAGIYLLKRSYYLEATAEFNGPFSFERDVLVSQAQMGKVGVSIQNGLFIDIGIPSDFKRAQSLFLK